MIFWFIWDAFDPKLRQILSVFEQKNGVSINSIIKILLL